MFGGVVELDRTSLGGYSRCMRRSLFVALLCLWMTTPTWAGESESFDPEQPFKEALSNNLLRSLFNEALDRLENHLELSGNLAPEESTSDRRGHLRLKFYPEGKAKSDQPLTAEGWFRLAPDDTVQDFSFRFGNPEKPIKNSSPQPDDVL